LLVSARFQPIKMQNWFKITKINNDIYKINEPYFREHANMYAIKGAVFDLLIDCGLGLSSVNIFLKKKGFNNIKVSLTHSHFDHAGGLKHFLSKDILVTKKIYYNLTKKNLWGLDFLKPELFNSQMVKNITGKSPQEICSNYNIELPFLRPCNLTKIFLGNYCFKVISVPGHTNDSIVLYDKQNKLLVTGDALYKGKIYCDFVHSNKKIFKKSLVCLKVLDFNLVLPGHNQILNRRQALEIIEKWLKQLQL
jgi:glyoxylase-like metal-dependent hydrolase (beta-lactamase superfamily II)